MTVVTITGRAGFDRLLLAGIAGLGFGLPGTAWASDPDHLMQEMTEHIEHAPPVVATEKHPSGHQLLVVPIPQSNPAIGTGLTLAAALFYNPVHEPEPWITGVGVMRTSNKSWGVGAVHKMSLEQDRFRVAAFAGYGAINMDFYGVGPDAGSRGVSIELEHEAITAFAQGQMRIAPHFYVGGRFEYLDNSTSINPSEDRDPLFPDAEIPLPEFESKLVSIGPVIAYDTRDSSTNPSNGIFATAAWLFSVKGLGSDFSHDKFTLNANLYQELGPSTVLAVRGMLCGTSDLAPFYDLCLYGMQNDLRGYETGRYRDRASWAVQSEVRQHLFGRFGAVAFAGVGGTAPRLSDLDDTEFLPSAGVGLRFMASRENRVNLRLDFAVGKDSHALYFGIGESF